MEVCLPGGGSGTWKEGMGGSFSSLLLPRTVFRKEIPIRTSNQPLSPISPTSIVKFPCRVTPKPRKLLCRNPHNQPDLWVIRKPRTNLPHQEKAGHLPALGNLCVNLDRFAVYPGHPFWSSARSQTGWQQSLAEQELSTCMGGAREVQLAPQSHGGWFLLCPRELQPAAHFSILKTVIGL